MFIQIVLPVGNEPTKKDQDSLTQGLTNRSYEHALLAKIRGGLIKTECQK